MSTLGTAVQARIATSRLVQLTNPNAPNATTTDTTYLELAVTDVEAEFVTYTSETFDSTNPRHVSLGVRGVVAKLRDWKGQDDADAKAWERWTEELVDYAKTAARARISPVSSKTAAPSPDDDEGTGTARPPFDEPRFRDYQIRRPPADDDRTGH